MINTACDNSIESLESSRTTVRSQTALKAYRGNVPNKHDEYLIQLQERNRLIKGFQNQRQPQHNNLRKRETGFQLYVNGAHSKPKQRPISITNGPSNRAITPSPYLCDFSFPTRSNTTQETNSLKLETRRQWTTSTKTKIKTSDGSIIADIDQSPNLNTNDRFPHSKSLFDNKQISSVTSKRAIKSAGTPSEAVPKSAWENRVIELNSSQMKAMNSDDEVRFSQMKPTNVDQSWMPSWFHNNKTPQQTQDYESDFEDSSDIDDDNNNEHPLLNRVSLSFDDIPSVVKLSIMSEKVNNEEHCFDENATSHRASVDSHVVKAKAT